MINPKFILGLLCLCITTWGTAQKDYTISGQITDGATGEDLINATVYIPELGVGTVSNEYGFYSLTLPTGEYLVSYEYLGFQEIQRTLTLQSNQVVNIEMAMEDDFLEEVVIVAEDKNANVDDVGMSKVRLNIETVKKIPALFGEVDVIKAIQLLPGVATVGEGGSGFYVRGGNVDQNLIILDEAPVYNASHLLGFFSVFNSDAIKDMQFYKGAIPASYGGRLSSVLDIRMKEGNTKKFSGSAGLGLLSSRLNLEGPIGEKASFMVAGRRTYADLFLAFSRDSTVKDNILYFYDLNAKFNYKINENNRIYLSGYSGQDEFGQKGDFETKYGNRTFTVRWNHLFSQKLFSNLTLYTSDYNYLLGGDEGEVDAFRWKSNLKDNGIKFSLGAYLSPRSTVKMGIEAIEHNIDPGQVRGLGEDAIINEIKLQNNKSREIAGYIAHEYDVTDRLRINYGLRYSNNANIGSQTILNYDSNFEVKDSTIHTGKNSFHSYGNIEPRIGVRYNLDATTSIKASYNRTVQYIHLASNSTSASPLDIWFLSNPNVKPQLADQYALGYFKTFKEGAIEASVEGYYKDFRNALDFKDHAQLLLNEKLEGELRFGKATSYGLEFLLRKNDGALTGWIAYTLSKTEKEIDLINNGKPYSAKYDNTHDLSIVANYDISQKWSVSGSWVYKTGAAVTLPTGKYYHFDQVVPVYSERNGERMPAFHRLDLSATLNSKKLLFNKMEQSFVFSVYNAYARKNPYSINFKENEDTSKVQAEKTYLFSIIPSFTYNLKF